MLKAIPASVITQMDAAKKRPAILVELGLSSTLRFAAQKLNITFPTAGNIYTTKAIKMREISQSLEGQIQRIIIDFDNVTKDMAAYVVKFRSDATRTLKYTRFKFANIKFKVMGKIAD